MPKTSAAPPEKVALYDKLVATNSAVERKGATMPYTAVNGNMFSFLDATGTLLLRLSDEDRDAFVAKYKTKPVIMHGAIMREYVAVPDALLAKTAQAKKYFDASYEYTSGLKAKPTKRLKKK